MSSPQERRYRNTQSVVGTGILVLGVWSLIRFVLQFGLIEEVLASYGFPPSLVWVVLGLACVDIAMRAYICSCARAVGRGEHKGVLYLVLAFLIALPHVISAVSGLALCLSGMAPILETATTAVVDCTCFCMTADFIVSAIRLRRLQCRGGEAHAD